MRRVTVDDLLAPDEDGPDLAQVIQSPNGEIIAPRPRPGYRFLRWETRADVDEPWQPVPRGGQAQRFVRAHYERRPG